MTARLTNKFQTSLTEPIAADSDNIKIIPEDIERLPVLTSGDWCPLNITDPRGWEEIVHVTKIGENGTLTVKRGMEGTTARTFQLNSRVDMRLTAASIESFLGLYYGARTKAPDNAPLGSLYLDISKTPNVMMTLGANGWSPATSFSLAGLRQQTFIADEGAQGPFVVDGGFSTGYANINGLSIYPGHGMTIDATKSSFKLDAPVQKDTVIVFHGYLANDAVDVFTKTEVNKRFADLTADKVKETNSYKIMTADERLKLQNLKTELTAENILETASAKIMTAGERNKIAKLDENYLAKSGGTISGALTVTGGVDANVLTVQGKARLCEGGNIAGPDWSYGDLNKHIENRCASYADDRKNACVTDSRIVNWVQLDAQRDTWVALPSGHVMVGVFQPSTGATMSFGGKQPQLYIANRGWFPLGAW